ncbi:MAG: YncE family protein, partial [Hyphomicrobium denitrificans]|nr:YncE family protein [Hyphomicrobium denitrificans]
MIARVVGLVLALTLAAASANSAEAQQAVYVLCQDAGVLAVIDTQVDEISARIELSGKPASFAINAMSGDAFVTQPETGKIVVADLKTHDVVRTLDIGGQPFGIGMDHSGELYVGDWSKERIAVVDPRSGAISKSI